MSEFAGRIVNIGVNKTGTGSLHLALQELGIPSAHYRVPEGNIKEIIADNHSAGRPLLTGLDHYRAFSDWNTPQTNHLFTLFDQQYPGTKFIMTTRSLQSWLDSREAHVLWTRAKGHKDGWLEVDRDAWTAEYEQHHHAVREYFADRPGDLLELDIERGDGWAQLCPFLGYEVRTTPFPHKNKSPRASRRLARRVLSTIGLR